MCESGPRASRAHTLAEGTKTPQNKQTNTMSTSDSVGENGGEREGAECVIRQCMKLLE